MIADLLAVASPPALLWFLVVLVAWGFGPGLITRVACRCFRAGDPRRSRMTSELYARRHREQPLWAIQQLERAVAEGLYPRLRERWRRRRDRG